MAACTFFGHRECPDAVEPRLWAVLETLIVEHGVDRSMWAIRVTLTLWSAARCGH